VTSRTLTPRSGAGLEVSGGGISARVKRLHVKWTQNKSEGPDQVVIAITNHTQRKVRLKPTRIRLVELRPRGFRTLARKGTDPAVPKTNPVGAVVGGAMAGARLGGSLSGSLGRGGGGSGMGGLAGGLGGAMAGAAVAAAVMIPIGGYLLIERALRLADRTIGPARERSLRVSLGKVAFEQHRSFALDLSAALDPPPVGLAPLPLVDVNHAHLGYAPPSSLRWIWLMRLGGGAVWEGPTTGGLGGVELFFGRQWQRFSLGAFATLGPGAAGLEARYQLPVTRWLTLVPLLGYGYTYAAGRFGWAVGHGPRAGLEIDFPIGFERRLHYERSLLSIGLYAHVGPLFLREREGVGLTAQFGVVVGMF
jgi:hypothetical protein